MMTKNLHDGVSYSFIETPRFKTTLMSVGFYIPSGPDNAANSLALSLLKSGTKSLPDLYSFNRKLASLYGAGVSSWTAKNGDAVELRVGITVNDDRYSLNGESTVDEAGKLLCDMIFSRYDDKSQYPEDTFQREKRLLAEKISGALNEKRTYARTQCEAVMCEGEPFGYPVDGTLDDANSLTADDVTAAIKRLIETAFISVIVVGAKEPATFAEEFKNRICCADREFEPLPENTVKAPTALREKNEKMPVKQGKLVLGLRSGVAGGDRETVAAFVMTDIFGGGPHGKLFCNVREKMSLCYYCAARPVRNKGLILVDSGVEENNMTKAYEAILAQFEDMKNGNFTETELNASKRSLIDMIRSAQSDQPTLARWYATRALDKNALSPEEMCEAIAAVTAEQITAAAESFALDTVYRLLPDGTLKEEDEE